MANPYHGQNSRLYMSVSGASTATLVTLLTEFNVDSNTDLVEITAFGDTNKNYLQGLKDFKGTFSGIFDGNDDRIFDAADSSTAVKMYIYPSIQQPTFYWYGTAWVNCSLSTSVSDAVKVSGSFAAATSFTRLP